MAEFISFWRFQIRQAIINAKKDRIDIIQSAILPISIKQKINNKNKFPTLSNGES
jgi:hypothetical protein